METPMIDDVFTPLVPAEIEERSLRAEDLLDEVSSILEERGKLYDAAVILFLVKAINSSSDL